MFKKIIYIFPLSLFLISCGDSLTSFKRGITGEKMNSADEFLVKKKDPLILPPDYENLPTPGEESLADEDNLIFKETLESSNENTSLPNSLENSVLKKIRSK